MSRLIGRIPNEFNNSTLKVLFMETQRVFNNLTGAWLRDNTVTFAKLNLAARSVPLSRLNWPEWHFPLALPTADMITTSTGFVRCSGIFPWNPAAYNMPGAWHLECYIAIADASQAVSARLMGTAEVAGSLLTHTGNTLMTSRRSGALTMPTVAQNLFVEFRSSAGAIASFGGARLVFIPN